MRSTRDWATATADRVQRDFASASEEIDTLGCGAMECSPHLDAPPSTAEPGTGAGSDDRALDVGDTRCSAGPVRDYHSCLNEAGEIVLPDALLGHVPSSLLGDGHLTEVAVHVKANEAHIPSLITAERRRAKATTTDPWSQHIRAVVGAATYRSRARSP